MDIRFDQGLTLEQKQQLVMTPAMMQAIQILQYSGQELEAFVQEQMMANPLLERKELPVKSTSDWSSGTSSSSGEQKENSYEKYTAAVETLTEHLMFQLEVSAKSKDQERIGIYIIESLDEYGYMTLSTADLMKITGCEKETVKKAIKLVQTFEPYGIGARSLAECLAIQLNRIGLWKGAYKTLIMEHLDDLSANRMKVIAKALGITAAQAQDMADVIRKLDPKPGLQFADGSDNKYIVPEIFVEEQDGEYVVKINDESSPTLIVSSYYEEMVKASENDKEVGQYLKDRLNAAMWLINNIEQRKQTIYNISQAIVDHQKDFFKYGSKHIKTLTLKHIAEKVGVHESTVSRTVNGKYLQSKEGVFELKYFFTAGDSDGNSSRSIKAFLAEMIQAEDKKHPLSDQKLMDMLHEKGIDISRRTVAKYREDMGVLSSSKRKRY